MLVKKLKYIRVNNYQNIKCKAMSEKLILIFSEND